MTSERLNYVQQVYEPKLPLKRTGGLLERCSERWENIPVIQLKTNPDWWGNAISDDKIGGLFAQHEDQPIQADGEYLKTLAAYVVSDLAVLKKNGVADKVTAAVTNPEMDNISVEITIEPSDQKLSIVPYRQYNKPETVVFWLSTLDGESLVRNTLDSGSSVLSNLGGITQ